MKELNNPSATRNGFTIVELLIVVVVIAILAAITIVTYNGITNQAKDATKASAVSQWQKAAAVHRIQTGQDDLPRRLHLRLRQQHPRHQRLLCHEI